MKNIFLLKKDEQVLKELNQLYDYANKYFILPITPSEIINKYKNKIFKINL